MASTTPPNGQLSREETRYLQLIANGSTADEAAEALSLARDEHVSLVARIKQTLSAQTIEHAVAIAIDRKLITLPNR